MSDQTISSENNTGSESAYVFDRGYQRYEGKLLGRRHSVWAIIVHSLKRALGIKRKWTSKIFPFILFTAAFLPVLGILSIQALFGTDLLTFGFPDAFGGLSLILLMFAAAAAPEMLCDDRRQRVLQLYFSRGITRYDYLGAKLLALGLILAAVSFLPGLLLYLGNAFLTASPFSALWNTRGDLLGVIVVSSLLSLLYASVALTVSSMTTRKGVASAIIIGFFIVGTGIVSSLFFAIDADWSRYLLLLQPLDVAEGIIYWAFTANPPQGSANDQANLSGWWYLVTVIGPAMIAAAMLYRTYLIED